MRTRLLFVYILFSFSIIFSLPFSEYSVIVKYKQPLAKSADAAHLFSAVSPDKIDNIPFDKRDQFAARLSFSKPQNIPQLVEQLNRLDHVIYAQPNYIHPVSYIPNDPHFSHQWAMQKINAEQAWDIVQGDSNVVIAIIDTGVDWQHPDLADAIWMNSREFLNGFDDDGNGLVDDIRGWDFVDRTADAAAGEDADDPDNDPMDFQGHGTFVAGCAAASTDNGIGVASPAFGAQIMALRAGFKATDGHGYILTFAALEAMQYAVTMGADVVNCSFGAAVDDKLLSDMALYALQSNVLVCWAAGNENSSYGVLPLSAPHVLTVASTDGNDNKSVFSNYGSWVKISAPGSEIYSTGRDNKYYGGSGTSYASPIVAGAAALLRAQHLDWTAGQIFMHLVDHADSIDHLDARYIGKLGKKGRLNLYNAVAEPFTSQPHFAILRKTIKDPNGNNNGFVDAGEKVELSLRLENQWADAHDVIMTLLCDDPAVHIENHQLTYEHIRGLELLGFNSVENSVNPFRFTVDNTFPHNLDFQLHIQCANGFLQTLNFQIAVNAQVLFVDDDEGVQSEHLYYQVMDSLGISYDAWDRSVQGKVGTHLLRYPIVIWSAEAGLPTLNKDDRKDIETFLQNGGMLFIAGQDVGWDLCAQQNSNVSHDYYNQFTLSSGQSLSFYQHYLHAQFLETSSAFTFLRGIENHPVSSQIEFSVFNQNLSLNDQSPDVVQPYDGESVFLYQNGNAGAVNYSGSYKVVNCAFGGLEAVAHEDDRYSLMQNIMNYFTGINLDVTPLQHTMADILQFHAQVVSEKNKNVYLYLSRDAEPFEKIEMHSENDSDYTLTLTHDRIPDELAYAVFAIADDALYAPSQLYHLDFSWPAPQVAIQSKNVSLTNYPFFRINVDSEMGVDEKNVFLHIESGDGDSLAMQRLSENEFGAFLPASASFGDSLQIFYSAQDISGKKTITSPQTISLGVEDFSVVDEWTLEKNWQHSVAEKAVTACIGAENQNTVMQYNLPMDFSSLSQATLQADIHYDLFDNRAVYLELSKDHQEWQIVGDYITGRADDYYAAQWSLAEFCGAGYDSVLLRFRLKSSAADSACVFSIRHIKILPFATVVDEQAAQAHEFALSPNFPNPFNSRTKIHFVNPIDLNIKVEVFDLLGKRVRILLNENQRAGEHVITWDGNNASGLPVASGIYLIKVTAGDYAAVRKISLIR